MVQFAPREGEIQPCAPGMEEILFGCISLDGEKPGAEQDPRQWAVPEASAAGVLVAKVNKHA